MDDSELASVQTGHHRLRLKETVQTRELDEAPMKITIEFIPHEDQRYNTIGDWFFEPPSKPSGGRYMVIKVSTMKDRRHMYLVAVHELVEALICQEDGISQLMVDKFDVQWKRPHLTDDVQINEPGEDPRAPYHEQHVQAENIERILAAALCVHWQTYAAQVDRICRIGE
jgi:hypothetical protein